MDTYYNCGAMLWMGMGFVSRSVGRSVDWLSLVREMVIWPPKLWNSESDRLRTIVSHTNMEIAC